MDSPALSFTPLFAGWPRRSLFKGDMPLLMGVLNVTPDSFSDGGDYLSPETCLEKAQTLIKEGADILDFGAESTRPQAISVDADKELSRLLPALRLVREACSDIILSVDSYKARVAHEACKAGCSVINDVKGLHAEPDMALVASDHKAGLIINHWDRENLAHGPSSIKDRLIRFFDVSLSYAAKAGVKDSHIMLDPGIGFNKTLDDNITILANLHWLDDYKLPIMIGTSRKSFIGRLTGEVTPKNRTAGTLASDLLAALQGVDAFRVHDIGAHKQALLVAKALFIAQEKKTVHA
jgi:dihydropteroate synthase